MIRRRLGLKNPMIFVFFRLTSSLNETTDYDLIGAPFLKRYFFTLSSIAKHFTRLALNRTRLTGIRYAVINCRQSVVYAGGPRALKLTQARVKKLRSNKRLDSHICLS
jgi:hypothetical protein